MARKIEKETNITTTQKNSPQHVGGGFDQRPLLKHFVSKYGPSNVVRTIQLK